MDDRKKLIGEYWYDWITDGSKENDVEDAGGISVVDRAESRVVKRESRRLVVVVGAESTCTSEEQEHAGRANETRGQNEFQAWMTLARFSGKSHTSVAWV